MKGLLGWSIVAALAGVYLAAFFAVLHPKISPAYKSYYIDRTSSDWNPEHYPGTPEQGINFSRKGLPDWVHSTYGFSVREDGGRWTDGDVARTPGLAFTLRLNGPLCLEFTASPAPSLIGKTIAVQMGNETKTLQVLPKGSTEYLVQFTQVQGADRLNFLLPERLPRESEVDRGSGDTRRLGLELIKLRVLPGNCATTAPKGVATSTAVQ